MLKKEISVKKALSRLLKTEKGNRIMDHNYGMDSAIIDNNLTNEMKVNLIAEVYNLLISYENRINVKHIDFNKSKDGYEIVINNEIRV